MRKSHHQPRLNRLLLFVTPLCPASGSSPNHYLWQIIERLVKNTFQLKGISSKLVHWLISLTRQIFRFVCVMFFDPPEIS